MRDSRTRRVGLRSVVALAVIGSAVVAGGPSAAQSGVVGINGAPCAYDSIVDAVADAQANDTIFVAPGTYDDTIGLIDFDLSIVGSGAACSGPAPAGAVSVVIDGNGSGATFGGHAEVVGAELILRDLTLQNAVADADGGLIYVDGGAVDLANVALIGGVADGDGGAIAAVNGSAVTVDSSFLLNNTAGNDGGAISIDGGSLFVQSSELSGSGSPTDELDPANADRGGLIAVTNEAVATINETSLVNARAGDSGGAIYLSNDSSELEVTGGEITGNSASLGGAFAQSDVTTARFDDVDFEVNGGFDGGTIRVVTDPASSGTQTSVVDSSIVAGAGQPTVFAEGPVELSFDRSTVSGQGFSSEGAVVVEDGASFTMVDSALTGSVITADGAGALAGVDSDMRLIRTRVSGNRAGFNGVGGIRVTGGTLTAVQTAVTSNTGSGTGGINATSAVVRLINSVVADNTGDLWGGIEINGTSDLRIEASTVVGNSISGVAVPGETPGAAGLSAATTAAVDIEDTIVWGNEGASGAIDVGPFAQWSSSIVEGSGGSGAWDSSFGFDQGDNIDEDPLLDDSWLPAADSPARDTGDLNLLPTDTYDIDGDGNPFERLPHDFAGRVRIRGPQLDIGALERPDRQFVLDSRPCVIYDTLAATGTLSGPLDGGEIRTLRAAGQTPAAQGVTNTCIPTEAEAGLFHVRAFVPQQGGNFRLAAAGVVPNGGVVNFAGLPTQSLSLENSNTVPSEFAFGGFVDLAANAGSSGASDPAAGASIHTVGYFIDEVPSFETGVDFFPLTPCAVLDSRSNQGAGGGFVGPFTGTTRFPVDVTGTHPAGQGGGSTDCGVPETAEGVILNIVAVSSTGAGAIGAVRDDSVIAFGATSFAQLPMNNATAIVVPIADDGTVSVTSSPLFGSIHIRAVVLGYVDDEPGLQFNPLPPCAVFDSRSGQGSTGSFTGKRTTGAPTTYQIAGTSLPAEQGGLNGGDCGMPEGAEYVMVNLVAINPLGAGNLRADATGSTPTGGVLNFAVLEGPMNNSNAVPIPLDELGRMDVFANGGNVPEGTSLVDVRGVILGYFD